MFRSLGFRVKGSKNRWSPPQYEPISTFGKLGAIRRFHFSDPLGGLGRRLDYSLYEQTRLVWATFDPKPYTLNCAIP